MFLPKVTPQTCKTSIPLTTDKTDCGVRCSFDRWCSLNAASYQRFTTNYRT